MRVRDALGRVHEFDTPPARVVSLVPSWTETLFSLGAGPSVVAATEFCVHPAEPLRDVARVGGTKNPNVREVLRLAPDLVIANKEENRRRDVLALEAGGARVFVTYARGVRDAAAEMRALGAIVGRSSAAEALAREVEAALVRAAAARSGRTPTRTVALVWRDPFMAVGADTFANDLLACAGAANPFARAGERRYPRVERAELEAAAPEVLLLPSEPYRFEERDRQELLTLRCPAGANGRVHCIEGELLSWYGPRMPRALETISALL